MLVQCKCQDGQDLDKRISNFYLSAISVDRASKNGLFFSRFFRRNIIITLHLINLMIIDLFINQSITREFVTFFLKLVHKWF